MALDVVQSGIWARSFQSRHRWQRRRCPAFGKERRLAVGRAVDFQLGHRFLLEALRSAPDRRAKMRPAVHPASARLFAPLVHQAPSGRCRRAALRSPRLRGGGRNPCPAGRYRKPWWACLITETLRPRAVNWGSIFPAALSCRSRNSRRYQKLSWRILLVQGHRKPAQNRRPASGNWWSGPDRDGHEQLHTRLDRRSAQIGLHLLRFSPSTMHECSEGGTISWAM
jgi:hypothetical protein